MPLPSENYTQTLPNSTGNKIRNLQITALDDLGNPNTVQMQVVNIADASGRAIIDMDHVPLLREILTTLRQIRTIGRLIADEVAPGTMTDDLLADGQLNENEDL